jgi:hypothetical protein
VSSFGKNGKILAMIYILRNEPVEIKTVWERTPHSGHPNTKQSRQYIAERIGAEVKVKGLDVDGLLSRPDGLYYFEISNEIEASIQDGTVRIHIIARPKKLSVGQTARLIDLMASNEGNIGDAVRTLRSHP